jgi:hypothetical protein
MQGRALKLQFRGHGLPASGGDGIETIDATEAW